MEIEFIEKQAATTIPVLPKEHRQYRTMNLDDAYEDGWYDALECVEKIPPADVRPVAKGRWEDCSSGWMCSNCSWTQIRESHYCPNCGAEMRGGDADGSAKD